jgi:hypothetical protein
MQFVDDDAEAAAALEASLAGNPYFAQYRAPLAALKPSRVTALALRRRRCPCCSWRAPPRPPARRHRSMPSSTPPRCAGAPHALRIRSGAARAARARWFCAHLAQH